MSFDWPWITYNFIIIIIKIRSVSARTSRTMGGAIGGGQGGHGPSNNLVGGAILYLAPQHFGPDLSLLFKMDEIW